MSEWKPIETAPKDGSSILVYTQNRYIQISRWDEDKYSKKPKPYWDTTGPYGKTWMRNNPPKYWMPLPEPPTKGD